MLAGCADSTICIAWWRCGSNFSPTGFDFDDLRPVERRLQRLQREVGAGLQRLDRDVLGGERLLERVLHRQQVLGELLDGVLVRPRDVGLRLLADVVGLGPGAQERVAQVGDFGLGLLEEVAEVGRRVRRGGVSDAVGRPPGAFTGRRREVDRVGVALEVMVGAEFVNGFSNIRTMGSFGGVSIARGEKCGGDGPRAPGSDGPG